MSWKDISNTIGLILKLNSLHRPVCVPLLHQNHLLIVEEAF
jgi:hypothetical protein